MGCANSVRVKPTAEGEGSSEAGAKAVVAVVGAEGELVSTFKPEVVSAQVWTGVGSRGFVFPELRMDSAGAAAVAEGGLPGLQAKPNFAVCLSGGGYRATACALGWIRMLHREGLLKHARYLTSVSGGSWFNAAFSYLPDGGPTATAFLGQYVSPGDFGEMNPTQSGDYALGDYGNAVAGAQEFKWSLGEKMVKENAYNLKEELENELRKIPNLHPTEVHSWSRAVGEYFLLPFKEIAADSDGLLTQYAYALADAGDAAESRAAAAAGVTKVLTCCKDPDMPFPIIVGSQAVPDDERRFIAYEFTPQYTGVPSLNADVVGPPGTTTYQTVGGVLIEPIGANSMPPSQDALPPVNGPPAIVKLNRQWNVPLVQAVGISSGAAALMSPGVAFDCVLNSPELCTFAVDGTGAVSGGAFAGFADGAAVDNLGVHAALRRGAEKLLACVALDSEPAPTTFAKEHSDVSSLFGAFPKDKSVPDGHSWNGLLPHRIPGDIYNKYRQVFRKATWESVVLPALQAWYDKKTSTDGKPFVLHLKDLDVMPNAHCGVTGGYKAEVIFLFNSLQNGGDSTGPQLYKPDGDNSGDHAFPYFSTMKLNYSQKEVNSLSNLSAYNMLQILPAVNELIGPVVTAPAAALAPGEVGVSR